MTTAIATADYSPDRIALLKRTVCKGATDDEFALFLSQCQRTGLDPFARQIHAVKRWDKQAGREVMSIQTGIDGYRLIADRTGLYAGSDEPRYDTEEAKHPNKATVTVWKLVAGQRVPFTRSARWDEFVQTTSKGEVTRFWSRMPYLMLGKVAEALALRAAFPQELSGVYTHEEMDQADPEPAVTVQPLPQPEPAKPALPAKQEEKPTHANMLRKCQTLNDLATYWNCIPTHQQKQFIAVKDEMKAKLSPEPPQADHAACDGDGEPDEDTTGAYIGNDLANAILASLNELGIAWDEVRDNHGKGMGLADLTGFQALMDVKLSNLSPEQGLRLHGELKRRVDEKRAKSAARKERVPA